MGASMKRTPSWITTHLHLTTPTQVTDAVVPPTMQVRTEVHQGLAHCPLQLEAQASSTVCAFDALLPLRRKQGLCRMVLKHRKGWLVKYKESSRRQVWEVQEG